MATQALDKMQREWEHAEMAVLEYRETRTFVIKVEESVSQQLDDHIVMTQSMSFSPYKKPFEDRITKWEQQLSLVRQAGVGRSVECASSLATLPRAAHLRGMRAPTRAVRRRYHAVA